MKKHKHIWHWVGGYQMYWCSKCGALRYRHIGYNIKDWYTYQYPKGGK